MPLYDAFISYSHAKDKPIAAALQSAVQRLGKPWYKRRALRLFRDDTSLAATPQLWPTIEQALGESRFLILLASPEAAASPWVDKEIAFWLQNKSADTLLIGVTDGVLAWDNAAQGFDRSETTPLPPALKGRLAVEPKWVDLAAYREGADTGDARFTELAADFAAAIRGMPKEDLLSQEVRQQRRALALATTAAGALLVLAIGATIAGIMAYRAQQEAVAQRNRAERTLAAATETANDLIFDLAQRFRDTSGVPAALVKDILDRARALQEQLMRSGQVTPELRRSQHSALNEIAETLLAQGDTKGALEAAEGAKQITQGLLRIDPGNADWQRDLSLSYNSVGDVLVAEGDLPAALTSFRAALDIVDRLAKAAPGNAGRQRDLSATYNRVGDVLMRQGNLAEALSFFRDGLVIIEGVAKGAPDNADWQRDLSVSYNKVGELQAEQGELPDALKSYRAALTIVDRLANAAPGNAARQRDLSVSLSRVGRVLMEQGDMADALKSFRDGLAIAERVAKGDPGNLGWQRDLALFHERVGRVLMAQDNLPEALEAFRAALAIAERLAKADPGNAGWQRDLSVALNEVGGVLVAQDDRPGALKAFRGGLAIADGLAKHDPGNARRLTDLVISLVKVSSVSDPPDARSALERALSIVEPLARDGKLSAAQQDWPEMIRDILATLPR
jgi:tetratricopeptide (TPR) repeat protein